MRDPERIDPILPPAGPEEVGEDKISWGRHWHAISRYPRYIDVDSEENPWVSNAVRALEDADER